MHGVNSCQQNPLDWPPTHHPPGSFVANFTFHTANSPSGPHIRYYVRLALLLGPRRHLWNKRSTPGSGVAGEVAAWMGNGGWGWPGECPSRRRLVSALTHRTVQIWLCLTFPAELRGCLGGAYVTLLAFNLSYRYFFLFICVFAPGVSVWIFSLSSAGW